jgi:hypothetical protein
MGKRDGGAGTARTALLPGSSVNKGVQSLGRPCYTGRCFDDPSLCIPESGFRTQLPSYPAAVPSSAVGAGECTGTGGFEPGTR